jgi:hypothetical protein
MSIARLYTDELHDKFNYLAIWYPTMKLSLAEIGYFNNQRIFVPAGKLDEHDVDLTPVYSPAAADLTHYSASGVDYRVKLKGKVDTFAPHIPRAAAGVGVRFQREAAIFLQLNDVTHERIGNQIALGRKMLELAKKGEWDKDWIVVTEVMRAKKFVVLVSKSSAGEAELTAQADFSALGIKALTAKGGLSVLHSHALESEVITLKASQELTPLFRAVRVKHKLFIGPRKVSPAYSSEIDDFVAAPEPDPLSVLEDVTAYPDDEEAE